MARFGDLEAAIMDVVWAAGAPVVLQQSRAADYSASLLPWPGNAESLRDR
jgi:hypothetical protein